MRAFCTGSHSLSVDVLSDDQPQQFWPVEVDLVDFRAEPNRVGQRLARSTLSSALFAGPLFVVATFPTVAVNVQSIQVMQQLGCGGQRLLEVGHDVLVVVARCLLAFELQVTNLSQASAPSSTWLHQT